MFNFKNFPELKKCHKDYQSLRSVMYKTEACYDRVSSVDNKNKIEKALIETQAYVSDVFAKVVFDIFNEIKPLLNNLRTKQNVTWDSVFNNDFVNLSNGQKKGLVSLVEENGGIYRLPKEYYK